MKKYLTLILVFTATYAFGSQYVMTKSVFSNGGATSSSSTYILKDAIGQSVIGQSNSATQIEQAGFFSYPPKKNVGVEENPVLKPKVFSLSSPFPNPAARENISIVYEVPRKSKVSIKVYSITGEVVKTLVSGEKAAGHYVMKWNGLSDRGTKVSNGLYFVRMLSSDFKATKKFIFLQ